MNSSPLAKWRRDAFSQPELPPERESSHVFSPKCQLPPMLWEDKSSWRMRIFSGGEAKLGSSGKNKDPSRLANTLYTLLTTAVHGCPQADGREAQAGTALLVQEQPPSPWDVAGPYGGQFQEQHRQPCEPKTSGYLITHSLMLTAYWNDILATLSKKILKFISTCFLLFFFNEVARQFKIIHVPGILFLECQDSTGIENSGIFGESVLKANDTEDI